MKKIVSVMLLSMLMSASVFASASIPIKVIHHPIKVSYVQSNIPETACLTCIG